MLQFLGFVVLVTKMSSNFAGNGLEVASSWLIGGVPYKSRVFDDGELYAVDELIFYLSPFYVKRLNPLNMFAFNDFFLQF